MVRRRLLAVPVTAVLLLAGCSAASDPAATPTFEPPPGPDAVATDSPAYDVALSDPVEDRVYPDVGDPGVDALHYDLDLRWDPDARLLTATEALVFRSTGDDDEFQLDLAAELEVRRVTLDGREVDHEHRDKDLVVLADVTADRRYVVVVEYAGTPSSVPAPTRRPDVVGLGWTTGVDGSAWTMQEPYGGYTWYAVNDQPSDKALYDFTLRVPSPWTGVANGQLESRATEDGWTVTEWHLADPAASYLVTVGFDEVASAGATAASGVPIRVWVPAEERDRLPALTDNAVRALDWAESRLGGYPFASLGFLFTGSTTGMETQTMISLGLSRYTTAMPVLVHEVVHQWWGDQVTPRDWRDLWMSEGMAMYLQALYESQHGGQPMARALAGFRADAEQLRAEAGPPAAYDPGAFAERNVYYLPALMWQQVRARIGNRAFFRLVRRWPAEHDNQNAGYRDIARWWEAESGVALTGLFHRHLLSERQP